MSLVSYGGFLLKALHALSALIKGNSTSELWFLFNNGLAMLRVDIQASEGDGD